MMDCFLTIAMESSWLCFNWLLVTLNIYSLVTSTLFIKLNSHIRCLKCYNWICLVTFYWNCWCATVSRVIRFRNTCLVTSKWNRLGMYKTKLIVLRVYDVWTQCITRAVNKAQKKNLQVVVKHILWMNITFF